MTKKERYARFMAYFQVAMPEANTELHYNNPFQLLCAVMLSAQCTDKRVNMVTPALFEAFPTPEVMAKATKEEVLHYVKSVSYPNSKAEHLVGMAKLLMERHGGEVPNDFDALVALPGVGRKTANVMLSVAFDKARMAVDTHVFRVSHRIGLVSDPEGTPLADSARTVCVQEPKTPMQGLRHQGFLQGRNEALIRLHGKATTPEGYIITMCRYTGIPSAHKAQCHRRPTMEGCPYNRDN